MQLYSTPKVVKTFPRPKYTDEELLNRAKAYNITSIEQLHRESDFSGERVQADGLKHLAARPPYRSDLGFWKLLLDYRIQHFGRQGATTIWRGLADIHPPVELSADDAIATAIFRSIVFEVAQDKDRRFLRHMTAANGPLWNRPQLLAEFISIFSQLKYTDGIAFITSRLSRWNHCSATDMTELLLQLEPDQYASPETLCCIYDALKLNGVYDRVVERLWDEGRDSDAFLMHKFLLSRRDLPSSFDSVKPFIIHLARHGQDLAPFLRLLKVAGVSYEAAAELVYYTERQKAGSGEIVNHTNRVSDSFAAKAFATKALSFQFVLNSLKAFGLTELGPQSLREMGLAARDMEEFKERLAIVDSVGIDTGSNAYSRFIRTLSRNGENHLLYEALQTDMHHEVFADHWLLTRLLEEHISQGSWKKVNLLLAILNEGKRSGLNDRLRADVVLAIGNRSPRSLLGFHLRRHPSNAASDVHSLTPILAAHLQKLIDLNQRTLRENDETYDKGSLTRLTAGIMQDAVANGIRFRVGYWRGLLQQMVRCGALDEMMSLAHWVLNLQRTQNATHLVPIERADPRDYGNTFDELFDRNFQAMFMRRSIMRSYWSASPWERDRWKRSLAFLGKLRQDHHVRIRLKLLQSVTATCCRDLFPGINSRSSIIQKNAFRQASRLCSEILDYMFELFGLHERYREAYKSSALRFLVGPTYLLTKRMYYRGAAKSRQHGKRGLNLWMLHKRPAKVESWMNGTKTQDREERDQGQD